MKYLKHINEVKYHWEGTDIIRVSEKKNEKFFKPYVNWKFVNDIIDMSLDYIDDGYRLTIELNWKFDQDTHGHFCNIFYPTYSTREYKIHAAWLPILLHEPTIENLKKVEADQISYKIELYDKDHLPVKKLIKELIDRAKRAYPDINYKKNKWE